jgi:hypothetical protein
MSEKTTLLTEILNLDPADPANTDRVFEYFNQYLADMPEKVFLPSSITSAKGLGVKYFDCLERISHSVNEKKDDYFKQIEHFLEACSAYNSYTNPIIRLLVGNGEERRLNYCEKEHSKLQSLILELYSEAIKYKPSSYHFELSGLFKPDQSNKGLIKSLIQEALDLIEKDSTLTDKTKAQLISQLRNILNDLNALKINWTISLGKMSEIIIVLGAIGSMIGGVSALREAEEKIRTATEVVKQTSIKINYQVVNDIFENSNTYNFITLPKPDINQLGFGSSVNRLESGKQEE